MNPAFLDSLRSLLGDGLITSREELRTYECDGLTNLRVVPLAVALPHTVEQVQAIVRLCAREHVAFVARGSGTGLSGAIRDGVLRRRTEYLPAVRRAVFFGVARAHARCGFTLFSRRKRLRTTNKITS